MLRAEPTNFRDPGPDQGGDRTHNRRTYPIEEGVLWPGPAHGSYAVIAARLSLTLEKSVRHDLVRAGLNLTNTGIAAGPI